MHAPDVELRITVPAALADSGTAERARVLLVLDAVRTEKLTWRAGADALGIAPERLLELARAHGVPVVRVEPADLHDDLATLSTLERARRTGS